MLFPSARLGSNAVFLRCRQASRIVFILGICSPRSLWFGTPGFRRTKSGHDCLRLLYGRKVECIVFLLSCQLLRSLSGYNGCVHMPWYPSGQPREFDATLYFIHLRQNRFYLDLMPCHGHEMLLENTGSDVIRCRGVLDIKLRIYTPSQPSTRPDTQSSPCGDI